MFNGDNLWVFCIGGGVSFICLFIFNLFVDLKWIVFLGLKYERVEIYDCDGEVEFRDELGNKLIVDDFGKDDLLII